MARLIGKTHRRPCSKEAGADPERVVGAHCPEGPAALDHGGDDGVTEGGLRMDGAHGYAVTPSVTLRPLAVVTSK